MSDVELEASRAVIEVDQLRCVIVQGLLPNIRQFVVTREGNDVNSLKRWLMVADAAAVSDPKDEISSVVKDIQKRLEKMHRVQFSVSARSPSASHDESGCDRSGSADRGWRDDGGVESPMSSRGRAKPRQMDTGVQILRLSVVLAFVTCVIAAGISLVNVRRTHKCTVAVAAVA